MIQSNVPQSHRLRFRTVVNNTSGPRTADNLVIDDAEEYKEYVESCTGPDDGFDRPVHWDREKLVAVALGERPTTGYQVEIVEIIQQTGGFVGLLNQVVYREVAPDGPAGQALTYPQHVVRVKNLGGLVTFYRLPDQVPPYTTLALGEEGPGGGGTTTRAPGEETGPTTLAVGEEGAGPTPTTAAIGEEGPVGGPTTLAVGEEGGPTPGPTTAAIGEEGGPTTLAVGEEGGGATTLAIGEEGGPTTLAVGEESMGMTTMMVGEEGPAPITMIAGEGPFRATTMATGEEDPPPTTMATGEETGGGWGRGGGWGPFGGF